MYGSLAFSRIINIIVYVSIDTQVYNAGSNIRSYRDC